MKDFHAVFLLLISALLMSCTPGTNSAVKSEVSMNKPLIDHRPGQIITLVGKREQAESVSKADEDKVFFLIDTINGKSQATKIRLELRFFSWQDNKLPETGAITLTGYLSGAWQGIPDEAFNYIPRVATTGFHFQTWFQVCQIR